MGKRIEMKKIENMTKRQVTFSKRRSSLIKKGKEIAICCDVDVLFVAFSPSGRLSKFCNKKSFEDILQRYISLPVERRLTHMSDVQEKVRKLRQLSHIKGDISRRNFLDKQIENLELQTKKSTLELQILDANIRDYEPGVDQEPSLHQLYWCEKNLQLSLQKVMARKTELEKQGMLDAQFAAQQLALQQFDNCINPYSANVLQNWIDKGKGVAGSSSNNNAHNPAFASSSQSGNISFSQIQSPSRYFPIQSQQQNIVSDVQQNPAQTCGQSEAQVTVGESSGNSIINFWHNICTSTRPISSPLSTTGAQLNYPSQLGLEYAHSNWNVNLNHNSNYIIQHNDHITQQNDHSSVQTDERAPNINGCNNSMEENTMGNNDYFVEPTPDNDTWVWDDDFLNETFSAEDFGNLD